VDFKAENYFFPLSTQSGE